MEPGDLYLDDGVHHALVVKFERDWLSEGLLSEAPNHDSPEWKEMEKIESVQF